MSKFCNRPILLCNGMSSFVIVTWSLLIYKRLCKSQSSHAYVWAQEYIFVKVVQLSTERTIVLWLRKVTTNWRRGQNEISTTSEGGGESAPSAAAIVPAGLPLSVGLQGAIARLVQICWNTTLQPTSFLLREEDRSYSMPLVRQQTVSYARWFR